MGINTAEAHYSMTAEQIAVMPVARSGARMMRIFTVWVTNPILTRQRESIAGKARHGGYSPRLGVRAQDGFLTWVKSEKGAGMGWFLNRGDTEHVLFAVRGNLAIPGPRGAMRQRVHGAARGGRTGRPEPDSFLDLVEPDHCPGAVVPNCSAAALVSAGIIR